MQFTIVVTEQELNILLTALQEAPAKIANPLTKKLQEQAKSQIKTEQPAESQE